MKAIDIEIRRIAQCLDDVCEWTKGGQVPTVQMLADVVACIHNESPAAYMHLQIRFENDFPGTKPCVYCNEPDHKVVDCQLAKVDATVMREEVER